ncbi:MAG: hypothetical protein ACRDJC_15595 [Thermomicrobiales bacterium]
MTSKSDDTLADATESMTGWPSAPAPGEPLFSGGWDQRAQASAPGETDSDDESTSPEATFWQETATNAWPTRPDAVEAASNPEQPAANPSRRAEADLDPSDGAFGSADVGDAVTRAERLLDELRETIGAIGQGAAPDLSDVISDLEVAVTPPGAVAPETVTALREALLTARERPRDLDTIVDLTQRIDALLALIIAYDRAIAAIERALDTLRRT